MAVTFCGCEISGWSLVDVVSLSLGCIVRHRTVIGVYYSANARTSLANIIAICIQRWTRIARVRGFDECRLIAELLRMIEIIPNTYNSVGHTIFCYTGSTSTYSNSQGRHFNFFLRGQNFFGLLENWEKQHFICSNLTLFVFLSFFLSVSLLFFYFFLFSFFFLFLEGEATAPSPLKWRPWYYIIILETLGKIYIW